MHLSFRYLFCLHSRILKQNILVNHTITQNVVSRVIPTRVGTVPISLEIRQYCYRYSVVNVADNHGSSYQDRRRDGFLMLWYPSKVSYRELTVLQLGSMRPFLICETRLSTPLYVPRAIDEATVSNCSARPRNLA